MISLYPKSITYIYLKGVRNGVRNLVQIGKTMRAGYYYLILWFYLTAETLLASGVIDLRQHDFDSKPISLTGQWLFSSLPLSPDQQRPKALKQRLKETMNVPGYWLSQIPSDLKSSRQSVFGYGVYFTEVTLPAMEVNLGLAVKDIRSAYSIRVWDETGQLIGVLKKGQVGSRLSEEIPTLSSALIDILPYQGSSLYILIEVSNYHSKKGGIGAAPKIGAYKHLAKDSNTSFFIRCFIIGGCVVIGLFHLQLNYQNYQDRSSLGFALCCLACATREIATLRIPELLGIFSPLLNFDISIRLTYASIPMTIVSGWYFFKELRLGCHGFERLARVICGYVGLGLIVLVLTTPTLGFTRYIILFQIHFATSCCLYGYLLLKRSIEGHVLSRKLFFALIIVFFGGVNDILYHRNIINTGWITPITFFVFILSQSAIISGLAAAAYRRAKHSFEQLAKVFYPHQIELMENGEPLEQSMPVGNSKACVISFDIVGSSRIRVPGTRIFFKKVFEKCGKTMMRNYQKEPLLSDAFRVKELGDGFICTVGFPFPSPQDCVYKGALELAEQFLEIFKTELSDFAYHENIYCSIGIAYGEVEAFYPDSPPFEYDLYGHGIVLATRYEQMRKSIFNTLNIQGHIIIVQNEVYNHFANCVRSRFQVLDLKEVGLTVRNDINAENLYYRLEQEEEQWQPSLVS